MSIHDPSEVPHVLTDAPPSQGAAAPSEGWIGIDHGAPEKGSARCVVITPDGVILDSVRMMMNADESTIIVLPVTDSSPTTEGLTLPEEKPEEENPPCWCGVENPHYDDESLSPTCGGSGTLDCRCGGDLCVCHHHGEVDCYGCEDCDGGGDPDDVAAIRGVL